MKMKNRLYLSNENRNSNRDAKKKIKMNIRTDLTKPSSKCTNVNCFARLSSRSINFCNLFSLI